jgi:hypothetical protein
VLVLVTTAAMLGVHWRLRHSSLEHVVDVMPWWMRGVAIAVLLLAVILAPGEDRAFIYFQF